MKRAVNWLLKCVLRRLKSKHNLTHDKIVVMNVKDKIDIITKKLDIVKSKSIGFMAISGGSWIYAIKEENIIILSFGIWIVFTMAAYGIIVNFLKMGELYKDLERIERDTV